VVLQWIYASFSLSLAHISRFFGCLEWIYAHFSPFRRIYAHFGAAGLAICVFLHFSWRIYTVLKRLESKYVGFLGSYIQFSEVWSSYMREIGRAGLDGYVLPLLFLSLFLHLGL
jgi:hypothetical protein